MSACNSTDYEEPKRIAQWIADTCWNAGVDLDGCSDAADVRAAVEAQRPEILQEVLVGHGKHDPTLLQWIEDRGAELSFEDVRRS
jgi:hypothetical protein